MEAQYFVYAIGTAALTCAVVFLVGMYILMFGASDFDNWPRPNIRRVTKRFLVTAFLLAVFVATSPFYFEFRTSAMVYSVEKLGTREVIAARPDGAFCFEWSGKCFKGLGEPIALVGSVAAVTPNPKVRNVHINIRFKISDPNKFFSGDRRRLTEWMDCGNTMSFNIQEDAEVLTQKFTDLIQKGCPEGTIAKAASFLFFEFNNSESKRLGEMHNPLDPNQQESLSRLVKDYFNPRLSSIGVSVEKASFGI